jgi:hypothetical protein
MNVRSRYKTREPVEVVQQLESCHHESVTNFPLIEKTVFPEKYSDFRSKKGKNHPLKKAKSHLDLTEVTDDGLKELKGLKNLGTLLLRGTWVTDEGLKALYDLKNLGQLDLSATAVTDDGVKALKEALPGCSMIHR